jgi:MFS family permease
MFIFGMSALILVLFLNDLGLSERAIGILLNVTLVGDAAISIVVVSHADVWGRRAMLLFGCLLKIVGAASMASQGLGVGQASFTVLVVGATIGVISPSGNEVGPFQALEQSILAQVVDPSRRTTVFAWYSLLGYVATAFGSLASGLLASTMMEKLSLSSTSSYAFIFECYGALSLVLIALTLGLSSDTESPTYQEHLDKEGEDGLGAPLLTPQPQSPIPKQGWASLSQESRSVLLSLSSLFALDSFAGSMVTGSLLAWFFRTRFAASDAYLGSILFGANLIAGPSSLLSGRVAERFGLINTMVWTHLPSNVLLIFIPLMPTLELAALMTFLRFTISQMDVVPRSSYVSGIVKADERTFTMGVVNVVKSLSSACGPLVTTSLAASGRFGWAFYLAGGLKVLYDLLLLWSFSHRYADHERRVSS